MRLAALAFCLLATTAATAADRVGYIHYDGRANLITEVRETVENGKTVYVVRETPSGFIYRQDYAPDGTVWR